ncbi:hypothetical protein DRQ53_05980 [bacterium]|nr:MAG: hypothetical protein DRQ53_05980 [bacterium]
MSTHAPSIQGVRACTAGWRKGRPASIRATPGATGGYFPMRPAVFALALLLLLTACSGDEYLVKEAQVQRGLAIRDAGLNPVDPVPLTRPTAWADARDADSVVVHFEFLPDGMREGDAELLSDRRRLVVVGEEDTAGFLRWEVELEPRAAEEALEYRFEAFAGTGQGLWPATGNLRVESEPLVVDFEWPDWPAPTWDWPTTGDPARVLDGAEDEATLAPAFPFDVIREPIWTPARRATIMANSAGIRRGIGIEVGGQAWFLPFAVMLWNEVANLTLGELRSGVSFCPLTDTILHFDSGFDPNALPKWHDWAPAGLFNSNLSVGIEGLAAGQASPFNQMLGYAFLGPDRGRRLAPRPAVIADINLWERLHPGTLVLEGDPASVDQFDYIRAVNPYKDYWKNDEIRSEVARTDDRMDAKDRVFGLLFPDDQVVLPLRPRNDFVHHTRAGGIDVVMINSGSMAIALHAQHPVTGAPLRLSRSRATWRELALFEDDSADPGLWTQEGVALTGPARGQRLAWVPSMSAFWFAWYAIYPEARFELPAGS